MKSSEKVLSAPDLTVCRSAYEGRLRVALVFFHIAVGRGLGFWTDLRMVALTDAKRGREVIIPLEAMLIRRRTTDGVEHCLSPEYLRDALNRNRLPAEVRWYDIDYIVRPGAGARWRKNQETTD